MNGGHEVGPEGNPHHTSFLCSPKRGCVFIIAATTYLIIGRCCPHMAAVTVFVVATAAHHCLRRVSVALTAAVVNDSVLLPKLGRHAAVIFA